MMTQDLSKSIKETINYGRFINQSPPDTIKSIQRLKRINTKISRQRISILFNHISSSSSSCRAASTDITDPLSPLLPIIHRLWLVFRTTSRILT